MTEAKPSQMRMTPGRNLTERLFNFVGREIVTGRYDGKRFPTEAILASDYHVSRPVTREAIKMLTAKGLLYARPKQGTFIQPIALLLSSAMTTVHAHAQRFERTTGGVKVTPAGGSAASVEVSVHGDGIIHDRQDCSDRGRRSSRCGALVD